jgi:hypothetical protein
LTQDGRGWCAFEFADQEAFRINCGDAGIIGVAGVPAFGCGPFHRYRDSSGRIGRMLTHGGRSYNGVMNQDYRQ